VNENNRPEEIRALYTRAYAKEPFVRVWMHRRHLLVDGRPILLDLPSLEAKLVAGRRGGYCFEQNALFAAVLDELGFAVTRLAARVRVGATVVRARTHMVLGVRIEGTQWLADVGFGEHHSGLLGIGFVPAFGSTRGRAVGGGQGCGVAATHQQNGARPAGY
jgi:hypothetical protein